MAADFLLLKNLIPNTISICQRGFTLHSDITQTIKAMFSLKQDLHLLEVLQSWRKLIGQYSQ